MSGGWNAIFGGQEQMNRAQRRAEDKKWAQMTRQQKKAKARARAHRTPPTPKEDQ